MAGSRRARVRRAGKWAGVAICVLMAVAWAASLRWHFAYSFVLGDEIHGLGAWAGRLGIVGRLSPAEGDVGWSGGRNVMRMQWWPEYFRLAWVTSSHGQGVSLLLPFWMLLLAVGTPTAWLFWRDYRRARPGHCACGYSRAGLPPGAPCPECGKVHVGTA